jgi:hypothetical protein
MFSICSGTVMFGRAASGLPPSTPALHCPRPGSGDAELETLAELRAREDELAREWQWLVDVLNKVARARADNGEHDAFRLLQQQCVAVGQRRVVLNLRMATLTGPPA